jgi:hypothetical protein
MQARDPIAYPFELEAAEAELIRERRQARHAAAPTTYTSPDGATTSPGTLPDDAVGLGLSGGGVRSATFCLGLFQAIGQAGRLRDIDFLSTVYYLDNHARSWLLYIKATLMGDEPEDVCHYHRAHPTFRRK